jgi:hypothetical protein
MPENIFFLAKKKDTIAFVLNYDHI